MADIQTTLSLDDSKYTSKLKSAENAAKTFGSSFSNSIKSVNTGLDSTAAGVDNLNNKFDALAKTIVGVGIAQFAASLLQSADNLKDLSDSLDVSVQSLMEMNVAASQSGGNIEKLGAMLGKMEQAAGDAAGGNLKLRVAFDELGLSMDDMTKLSPDEAFNKIAKSLADITSPAERAAKASDIFGKTFKGFSFSGYVSSLQEVQGTMGEYAAAQVKAAELSDRLETSIGLLRNAFLELLSPVMDLIPETGSMKEQMDAAGTAATVLGVGLAAIVGGQVISGFRAIVGALTAVTAAFATSAVSTTAATAATVAYDRALTAFSAGALGRVGTATAALATAQATLTAMQATGTATAAALAKAQDAVAVATLRLESAQAGLVATSAAATAAMSTAGIASTAAAGGIAATGTAATAATGPLAAFGVALGRLAAFAAPILLVVTAIEGINWAVKETGKLFDENFSQGPVDGLATVLESFIKDKFPSLHKMIEKTGDMLGMGKSDLRKASEGGVGAVDQNSEAAIRQAKALGDAQAKLAEQAEKTALINKKHIEDVTKGYTAQAEGIKAVTDQMTYQNDRAIQRIQLQTQVLGLSKAEQQATLAAFDAQTKYHNQAAEIEGKINDLVAKRAANPKEFDMAGGERAIQAYRDQLAALQDMTSQVYELKKAEQERADVLEMSKFYYEEQKKGAEAIRDVQYEIEDLTATSDEKRLFGVERLIEKERQLAIEKRKAQLGITEGDLDANEIEKINQQMQKAYGGLYEKNQQFIKQSREFSTGWKKAMKEYISDSTNAAKQAETLFKKATQGMTDAIVGFAKTGKFEWKDFVSMMLEELLRSQIQSTFASLFSSMSGTMNDATNSSEGGVMSALSSLFGGGSSSSSGSMGSGAAFGGQGSGTPVFVTNWPGGSTYGSGVTGSGQGGSAGGSMLGGAWDAVSGWFGDATSSTGGSDISQISYDALMGNGGADTSWMDSVSSSFSDLGDWAGGLLDSFDGWFAGGGNIGPGKFGIAGEAGAEIITGPATVTPISQLGSGGSQQVTYNIYANDAKSFQQMLASDPSFIHALVMQGSKGMPA